MYEVYHKNILLPSKFMFYKKIICHLSYTFFRGNLIEAFVCLMVLFNVFGTIRLNKMVTIICSVMTSYKTVLFVVYSFDFSKGGREFQGLLGEFLIFGLGSIWLLVPAYVTWVLIQDFVDIKPKGAQNRSSPKKAKTAADDSLNGSGYNLRPR